MMASSMRRSSGVAAMDKVTASVKRLAKCRSMTCFEHAGSEQHEGELAALTDHETEAPRGSARPVPTSGRAHRE